MRRTTDPEADGKRAAEAVRADVGLGVAPIADVAALVDRLGFDVAVLPAPSDQHGYTVVDPQLGHVFIGVATTDHPMRQRASLAHELGHALFEDWGEPGQRIDGGAGEAEQRAQAFARHLLVPQAGLHEATKGIQVEEPHALSMIVQWFLASPAIVLVALSEAGLITSRRQEMWRNIHTPGLAARYGWMDQYEALAADAMRRRAPQRLVARAVVAYEAGVLSAQAVGTLRGIPADRAEEVLREEGITPSETSPPYATSASLPEPDIDPDELERLLGGHIESS